LKSDEQMYILRPIHNNLEISRKLTMMLRLLNYRLAFGQHKHHLVILENDVAPRLMEGECLVLKDMT